MNTKTIVLIVLACFFLFFLVYLLIFDNKSVINIQSSDHKKLLSYKNAYVDVQNNNYKTLEEKRSGRGAFWVKGVLEEELNSMKIKTFSYDNKRSPTDKNMSVICSIDYGWGIPEIGRHFIVEARFRKNIKIKFIDEQTKEVITNIFYRRGFFKKQYGDIEFIMKELKNSIKGFNQATVLD